MGQKNGKHGLLGELRKHAYNAIMDWALLCGIMGDKL